MPNKNYPVKELLGHGNLSTTERWTAKMPNNKWMTLGELEAKHNQLLAASKCALLDLTGLVDANDPEPHHIKTIEELTNAIWLADQKWIENTMAELKQSIEK